MLLLICNLGVHKYTVVCIFQMRLEFLASFLFLKVKTKAAKFCVASHMQPQLPQLLLYNKICATKL